MSAYPAPYDVPDRDIIDSFVADFAVSCREGPLSTPERLAHQVRTELLPALEDVFADPRVAGCDARIEMLEVDLGHWPADPDWPRLRENFRAQLIAALALYLTKRAGGRAATLARTDAQSDPVTLHHGTARKNPDHVPPGQATVIPIAGSGKSTAPRASLAHLTTLHSISASAQEDAISTLRAVLKNQPEVFEDALRALPQFAHRQALHQLVNRPDQTLSRTRQDAVQAALTGIFKAAGHPDGPARQAATTLTARLMLHPVGARLAHTGLADDNTKPGGTPSPAKISALGEAPTEATPETSAPSESARPPSTAPEAVARAPEDLDTTDLTDVTVLRARWQADQAGTAARLTALDVGTLSAMLRRLVPKAGAEFQTSVETLQARVKHPQAALLFILGALLEDRAVDLIVARQIGETSGTLDAGSQGAAVEPSITQQNRPDRSDHTDVSPDAPGGMPQQAPWDRVLNLLTGVETASSTDAPSNPGEGTDGPADQAAVTQDSAVPSATFRHRGASVDTEAGRSTARLPDDPETIRINGQSASAPSDAQRQASAGTDQAAASGAGNERTALTGPFADDPISSSQRATVAEHRTADQGLPQKTPQTSSPGTTSRTAPEGPPEPHSPAALTEARPDDAPTDPGTSETIRPAATSGHDAQASSDTNLPTRDTAAQSPLTDIRDAAPTNPRTGAQVVEQAVSGTDPGSASLHQGPGRAVKDPAGHPTRHREGTASPQDNVIPEQTRQDVLPAGDDALSKGAASSTDQREQGDEQLEKAIVRSEDQRQGTPDLPDSAKTKVRVQQETRRRDLSERQTDAKDRIENSGSDQPRFEEDQSSDMIDPPLRGSRVGRDPNLPPESVTENPSQQDAVPPQENAPQAGAERRAIGTANPSQPSLHPRPGPGLPPENVTRDSSQQDGLPAQTDALPAGSASDAARPAEQGSANASAPPQDHHTNHDTSDAHPQNPTRQTANAPDRHPGQAARPSDKDAPEGSAPNADRSLTNRPAAASKTQETAATSDTAAVEGTKPQASLQPPTDDTAMAAQDGSEKAYFQRSQTRDREVTDPTAADAVDALVEATFGAQALDIRAALSLIWQATPTEFTAETRARFDAQTRQNEPARQTETGHPPVAFILDLIAVVGPSGRDLHTTLQQALALIAPDTAQRHTLLRHLIARLSYAGTGAPPALRLRVQRSLTQAFETDAAPQPADDTAARSAPVAPDTAERLLTAQAGLVLFHPFYKMLFSRLNLLTPKDTLDRDQIGRSRAVLAALAGADDLTRPLDPLARLLLGLADGMTSPPAALLEEEDLQLIDGLIRSVIAQWAKLGQTSPAGLQDAFIRRVGQLHQDTAGAHLRVDPGAYDVLLDSLPWSVDTVIALPWMPVPCHVTWRAQDG